MQGTLPIAPDFLDPRIVTKFYGKRFLAALPSGVEPEVVV
jgi:hypothetical protein